VGWVRPHRPTCIQGITSAILLLS